MSDLVLILRYRKAVTYGFHTLLAALEEHATDTRYEVVFAESAQAAGLEYPALLEQIIRVGNNYQAAWRAGEA